MGSSWLTVKIAPTIEYPAQQRDPSPRSLHILFRVGYLYCWLLDRLLACLWSLLCYPCCNGGRERIDFSCGRSPPRLHINFSWHRPTRLKGLATCVSIWRCTDSFKCYGWKDVKLVQIRIWKYQQLPMTNGFMFVTPVKICAGRRESMLCWYVLLCVVSRHRSCLSANRNWKLKKANAYVVYIILFTFNTIHDCDKN